jgi:hypothetical protein
VSDRLPARDPLVAMIAELREPVAVDPGSKRRLMDMVREAPPPVPAVARAAAHRPRSHTVAAIRRMRGDGPRATSFGTFATAAGIALLMVVGTREPSPTDSGAVRRAVVIGDSVASVASAFRDTLRIVQFILTAPAASRVALAGDFNGWDTRATQLARTNGDGRWSVTLALAPGRHSYAYVVDDTQWVRDPVGTPAEPNELTPPKSVLVVEKE